MPTWSEQQLFKNLKGEHMDAFIVGTEPIGGSKNGWTISMSSPDAERFSPDGMLLAHAYLDAQRELVTVMVPFQTQVEASRYGWALDFVNTTTNEVGRGYLIKTHVDPPDPADQHLAFYCSWEFPLDSEFVRTRMNLSDMRAFIAAALLRICDDCCTIIISLYARADEPLHA